MMDLLIVGPPGPLLRWACDLVGTAVSAQGIAVAASYVGQGDDWQQDSTPTGLRLLTANVLPEALLSASVSGHLPTLKIIDEPARCLAEMRQAGHDLGGSLRHLTACAMSLGKLAGRENTLLITRDDARDPAQATRTILAFASLDPLVSEAIPATPALEDAVALPQDESELVTAVLMPAFHYAATGTLRPTVWLRSCLYWGDHPGERVPRIIDLTGPARVLVYGPYLHLPAGHWTARATVAFSKACQGASFALELLAGTELGRVRFRVPQAGLFEIACPALVPAEAEPLEMRLVAERGAIEGTLGIDRVELHPEAGEA
jgi:hypothetical protein